MFKHKNRLTTSDSLLIAIQEKIKWADTMSELDKKHKEEVEERMSEVKKSVSFKVSTINSTFHHWTCLPLLYMAT